MSGADPNWISSALSTIDTIVKVGGGALLAYFFAPALERIKIQTNAKNEYGKLFLELRDIKVQLNRDIKRLYHAHYISYKAEKLNNHQFDINISVPKSLHLIRFESSFENAFLELTIVERNDLRSVLEIISVTKPKQKLLQEKLYQLNTLTNNEIYSLLSDYCILYWLLLKITEDNWYDTTVVGNNSIETKLLSLLKLDMDPSALMALDPNMTADKFISRQ